MWMLILLATVRGHCPTSMRPDSDPPGTASTTKIEGRTF
jgi:hypothetical protein